MGRYTEQDVIAYRQYIQDVLDLNSYISGKLEIYDKASVDINTELSKICKAKVSKDDIKNGMSAINKIWDESNRKVKTMLFNKPVNAGSAVDHLVDTKKLIGKCDMVKDDENTLYKALAEYVKDLNKIKAKWVEGGSERKKMMASYNFIQENNRDLFPYFRKLDYISDITIGESIRLIKDDELIMKKL